MNAVERSPFSLTGLRVLVTGAGGGIGGATARLCANLGAELVLVDRVEADVVRRNVGDVEAVIAQCDMTDRKAVDELAASVGAVDALIDTAAINPFDNWVESDWDETFDQVLSVNTRGPINLVRAFSPPMLEGRFGRIVLFGSLAGRMGGLRNGPHYAVSKGGIHALTRWYASRFTPKNVLVNAIAPGATATPMIANQDYTPSALPLGRLAQPEEQAAAAAFLISPAASYIAGVVLDVNGGLHFS